MKKNKFKIVESELFKKQKAKLPTKVKKSLAKALKRIARNPTKTPGSMELFSKPSAQELRQWMDRVRPETIDLVFEYLNDKDCLNKKGKILAGEFWEKYIHTKER